MELDFLNEEIRRAFHELPLQQQRYFVELTKRLGKRASIVIVQIDPTALEVFVRFDFEEN